MASSSRRSSAGGRPPPAREGLAGKSGATSAQRSSGTVLGVGTSPFYRSLPVCRHAFNAEAHDLEIAPLRQGPVLPRREMHVGPAKALEIPAPARGLAGLFDHVLDGLALALGDEAEDGAARQLQRLVDRTEGFLLFDHPMERVE